MADHPRACGANRRLCAISVSFGGSSPRMRGKHATVGMVDFPRRIIPAHAGQTGARTPYRGQSADHPRACGANDVHGLAVSRRGGSSPRMRGKHFFAVLKRVVQRIIPAHAGQTKFGLPVRLRVPDHPRACGANLKLTTSSYCAIGSSPRMRGKRAYEPREHIRSRIIPAHAGQTFPAYAGRYTWPDHPRACGANLAIADRALDVSGSSPRMRGKQAAH